MRNTATQLADRGHRVTIVSGAAHGNGIAYSNGIPTRRIGRSVAVYGNGAIAHFAVGLHIWRDLG